MKNLTPAQLMRLAGYFVAVLLGAFMVIWGVVHGDAALVTAGIGLIGTGGIAGANINTGPVLLDATLEEHEAPFSPVRGDHAEVAELDGPQLATISRKQAALAKARAARTGE